MERKDFLCCRTDENGQIQIGQHKGFLDLSLQNIHLINRHLSNICSMLCTEDKKENKANMVHALERYFNQMVSKVPPNKNI